MSLPDPSQADSRANPRGPETDPHAVAPDYESYLPTEPSEREGFLARSYGGEDRLADILSRVSGVSKEAVKLVADPGVIQNIDYLEGLADEHPGVRDLSAKDLRTALSRKLGTQVVYRAIKAFPEEVESIQAEGVLGPRKRRDNEAFDLNRNTDFQRICINHSLGPHITEASGCVFSVSDSPNAAIGLTNPYPPPEAVHSREREEIQAHQRNARAGWKGELLYLVELEVPKLSMVNFDSPPFSWERYENSLRGAVDRNKKPAELMRIFGEITEEYGRRAEDFCMYGARSLLQLRQSDGTPELEPMIGEGGRLVERFVFGELSLADCKATFAEIQPNDPRIRWAAPLPWVTPEELARKSSNTER